MQIITTFTAMFLVFVLVEALMLTFFMGPFFSKHIGHLMRPQVNLFITLVYYIMYVAGVFYFCYFSGFKSGSIQQTLMSGFFLGLLCYGVYDITNYLVLKDWKVQMTLVDMFWGGVVTSLISGVGFYTFYHFMPSE